MRSPDHPWSEEFGHPKFLIWAPAVVSILFLAMGIGALTDSETQGGFVFWFWIFWTTGIVGGLIVYFRVLAQLRFRVRVSNEGIQRLRPDPPLKARWSEVAVAETTVQSLTLAVAGGEIVIPRALPDYPELYRIISDHVPASVLHPTSGLPLLLHYQSFNSTAFTLAAIGSVEWFVLCGILYYSGGIPPVWFALMMTLPVLRGIQALYGRSKQYEFHADRIVVRSMFNSKEYPRSDLKDGYLDESYYNRARHIVLRLVFTNGESLEVRDGNISAEELYKVLKPYYSLI